MFNELFHHSVTDLNPPTTPVNFGGERMGRQGWCSLGDPQPNLLQLIWPVEKYGGLRGLAGFSHVYKET